jgi:hypothetical protein
MSISPEPASTAISAAAVAAISASPRDMAGTDLRPRARPRRWPQTKAPGGRQALRRPVRQEMRQRRHAIRQPIDLPIPYRIEIRPRQVTSRFAFAGIARQCIGATPDSGSFAIPMIDQVRVGTAALLSAVPDVVVQRIRAGIGDVPVHPQVPRCVEQIATLNRLPLSGNPQLFRGFPQLADRFTYGARRRAFQQPAVPPLVLEPRRRARKEFPVKLNDIGLGRRPFHNDSTMQSVGRWPHRPTRGSRQQTPKIISRLDHLAIAKTGALPPDPIKRRCPLDPRQGLHLWWGSRAKPPWRVSGHGPDPYSAAASIEPIAGSVINPPDWRCHIRA